mgnify:CR=1 FL=1
MINNSTNPETEFEKQAIGICFPNSNIHHLQSPENIRYFISHHIVYRDRVGKDTCGHNILTSATSL